MLTLAGTLYTPFADAVLSECTVTFVALRTGDAVVQHSSASVTTDDAGNYTIDLLPGRYDIAVDIERRRRFLARNLEVTDDTPADTINDLVTLAAQSEGLTDERVSDYRALVAEAKAAQVAAEQSAQEAAESASYIEQGAKGDPGKPGQIRFTGHGAPTTIVGAMPDDTYLDLDTGHIYKLT